MVIFEENTIIINKFNVTNSTNKTFLSGIN